MNAQSLKNLPYRIYPVLIRRAVPIRRQSKGILRRLASISFYHASIALISYLIPRFGSFGNVLLGKCNTRSHFIIYSSPHTTSTASLRIETNLLNEMKPVNLLGRVGSLVTLELIDLEDESARSNAQTTDSPSSPLVNFSTQSIATLTNPMPSFLHPTPLLP